MGARAILSDWGDTCTLEVLVEVPTSRTSLSDVLVGSPLELGGSSSVRGKLLRDLIHGSVHHVGQSLVGIKWLLLRRSRYPRSGNFALTMFSTFDELDGRLNCVRISPIGLRERLYVCFERPDERKEL